MYKVEIIEPNRVIFKNEVDQSYITVAVNDADKEGIEHIKSLKVGDEFNINFKSLKDSEQDTLLEETNIKLQKEIDDLKAIIDKTPPPSETKTGT